MCYNFFIVEIIAESVNLKKILNRKFYQHDEEQFGFYKKVQIKTQNSVFL